MERQRTDAVVPFEGPAAPRRRRTGEGGGPKYGQVANHILARIEAGEWKPGDQLPSEADLARALGVSLGTVQKALQLLVEDRVVVRRHGRGTFVGAGRAPEEALRHFRFLSEGGDRLLPVFSRVLAIEETEERGPWSDFLAGESRFVTLKRLLAIGGEFEVYSEFHLPAGRVAGLAAVPPEELDGVLLRDYLAARFNMPTLRVEQRLRCTLLPPRVCNLIHVTRGSMGIEWRLLGFSYRDAPAIFQRAWVPPTDRPLQILEAV
ncbi:GntR family transcriptional regulator [Azospirillum sp. ST 5-10]|uniref:GntR family transcriptional regulator n=1 Tax=unclassified Azospirillum TaxID=2630922 RepID=UPI003F4A251C